MRSNSQPLLQQEAIIRGLEPLASMNVKFLNKLTSTLQKAVGNPAAVWLLAMRVWRDCETMPPGRRENAAKLTIVIAMLTNVVVGFVAVAPPSVIMQGVRKCGRVTRLRRCVAVGRPSNIRGPGCIPSTV